MSEEAPAPLAPRPDDAQMVEVRVFPLEQIARVFSGAPIPPLVPQQQSQPYPLPNPPN